MAGLENPSSGAVELAGGQRPQMVFQDAGASLTPWLSVGELIAERLRGNGMSRSQRQDAVAEVLQRVGLPLEVAKSRAGQLSGGQRQRVSPAPPPLLPPPRPLPAPPPTPPARPLPPPTGCAFRPRCPIAIDTCSESQLDVRLEGAPGNLHQIACIERKAS